MKRMTFVMLGLCAIAACNQSLEEYWGPVCQDYGFTPGTDAYAECIQRETHNREQVLMSLI